MSWQTGMLMAAVLIVAGFGFVLAYNPLLGIGAFLITLGLLGAKALQGLRNP